MCCCQVSPAKLAALTGQRGAGGVEAWVQVACPRLSIDWGEEFAAPTLNPYEVGSRGGGGCAAGLSLHAGRGLGSGGARVDACLLHGLNLSQGWLLLPVVLYYGWQIWESAKFG